MSEQEIRGGTPLQHVCADRRRNFLHERLASTRAPAYCPRPSPSLGGILFKAVIVMNTHLHIAMQYEPTPTGFGDYAWPRAKDRGGIDVLLTID